MKQSPVNLVERLLSSRGSEVKLDRAHLWQAITGALDARRLINNLAEAMRLSASATERLLIDEGFGDVVAQLRVHSLGQLPDTGPQTAFVIDPGKRLASPFPDYFSLECRPALNEQIQLTAEQYDAITLLLDSISQSVGTDPFLSLYRTNVLAYHDDFVAREGEAILSFLRRHFGHKAQRLRYLVNSGIGANQQFNHFAATVNNANPNRRVTWYITESSRHLYGLPADADLGNTLFMEFSRSGKTEETVKIHEFTSPRAIRIVFANSGPLRALAERDAHCNLRLDLPDQVSGRFGRNKTPILLAPMLVAGLDTSRYWQTIDRAIAATDLASTSSLPAQLAQFLYIHQLRGGSNHIYLGCNHDTLACSADEFVQFWNEGVNKEGNDILMSRYFGLLRDSHASIEGILANARSKVAIFLLAHAATPETLPPLACAAVNPINPDHAGLKFGDEERVLAQANYEHMSRVMPCLKIEVRGTPDLDRAAVLGQLWSDVTYFYSKLRRVDPGSNPEVKHVRDRAAALLAAEAERRRSEASDAFAAAVRAPGESPPNTPAQD